MEKGILVKYIVLPLCLWGAWQAPLWRAEDQVFAASKAPQARSRAMDRRKQEMQEVLSHFIACGYAATVHDVGQELFPKADGAYMRLYVAQAFVRLFNETRCGLAGTKTENVVEYRPERFGEDVARYAKKAAKILHKRHPAAAARLLTYAPFVSMKEGALDWKTAAYHRFVKGQNKGAPDLRKAVWDLHKIPAIGIVLSEISNMSRAPEIVAESGGQVDFLQAVYLNHRWDHLSAQIVKPTNAYRPMTGLSVKGDPSFIASALQRLGLSPKMTASAYLAFDRRKLFSDLHFVDAKLAACGFGGACQGPQTGADARLFHAALDTALREEAVANLMASVALSHKGDRELAQH